MKIKMNIFLFSSIIISSALIFSGCSQKNTQPMPGAVEPTVSMPRPDVDSVSAASTTYYFENNSLSGDELAAVIHDLQGGALSIATVNEDGSPNLAFAGPDMVTDDVLMFGLSQNQTRENIQHRKLAVAGVYLFDPEAEKSITYSKGARIILKLIEDPNSMEELKQLVPDAPEDVLFMRIVRILPVG